jgi:sulfonate transport system substrate-binding protein
MVRSFLSPLVRRALPLCALLFASLIVADVAFAATVLRIGDQKGNARAVMEAAGELAGAPYTIEWSEFQAAAPLLEAANAGAIDAGTVGDAPFTFAVAAGVPIKAIVATRTKQEGLAIVVRDDSPAHSFRDLVGKRIGTGRGSIGHQLVLTQLDANGLKPRDVDLTFLLPSEAAAALMSGAIDAWSTWDPYTAQLEVLQGYRRVADGVGVTPGLSFFFARDDALADKAERTALEDFVGRLSRARKWGAVHLDSYAATWSRIVGLPLDVALKIYRRGDLRAAPIDASVVADEQKSIDLYLRYGLIAKSIDASTIVDPIFTPAIIAGIGQ